VSHSSFNNSYLLAVSIIRSSGVVVEHNEIRGSHAGIYLGECTDSAINSNIVKDCNISKVYSLMSYITSAITLYKCQDSRVMRNTVENVTGNGVVFGSTTNITFLFNDVVDCTGHGLHASGSRHTIHHNNFIGNNGTNSGSGWPQCYDSSLTNTWDNTVNGNYWSDYRQRYPAARNNGSVWNTPYGLAGRSNNFDNHPLVNYQDYSPPSCFAGYNITINQNETVHFSGRATDNVGVVRYDWWFTYDGANVTLNGREPSFTFDLPGEYLVTLRVEDAVSLWDMSNLTVFVLDTEPPVAVPGDDTIIPQGTNLTLTGSSSTDNVGITNFTWSFIYNGSVVTLNGSSVPFIFDVPGKYLVRLTVSDLAGNTAWATMTVEVLDTEPPSAEAGADRTVPQDEEVTFSALGSKDNVAIVMYQWTVSSTHLPDIHLNGMEASHVFDVPGTYLVTLNVSDAAGNWAIAISNLAVLDTERPSSEPGDDLIVGPGTTVTLDGSGSRDNVGVTSWTWTISAGDGQQTLHGMTVDHQFDELGLYVVHLNVSDGEGNWDMGMMNVTVRDITDPVAVAGEDVTVDQGDTVDLDGSGSRDNVGISGHTWTFTYEGEEVSRQGSSMSFTFHVPGQYIVTLAVDDLEGNVGTDTVTVTVRDTEAPVAVAGEDIEVDQYTMVTFNGSDSHDNVGVEEYWWVIFYQGVALQPVLTGPDPVFKFVQAGVYNITLTVIDPSSNRAVDNITVTVLDIDPPVAVAGEDIVLLEGHPATFDGSNSTDNVGIVSWTWTFEYKGTQQELPGETASFTLRKAGEYTVTLTVADARGNTAEDNLVVTVNEQPTDDDGGLSLALIGVLAIAVAILAVAAIVIKRRSGTD
jgi:hypothetical protein